VQIGTGNDLGDGTDAAIDVTWWCGQQAGTNKRVPLSSICNQRGDLLCFET